MVHKVPVSRRILTGIEEKFPFVDNDMDPVVTNGEYSGWISESDDNLDNSSVCTLCFAYGQLYGNTNKIHKKVLLR